LTSEPARDNEPDRALNSEVRSARLVEMPIELLRFMARPLKKMPLIPSEFDRDLNKEIC